MTKADFIRKLARQGFTDLQILVRARDKFGFCSAAYVRTCARQRISGSSEADKRYQESSLGQIGYRKRLLAGTVRSFGVQHGSAGGAKVLISVPSGRLDNVSAQKDGTILLTQISGTCTPIAGNDELTIVCA